MNQIFVAWALLLFGVSIAALRNNDKEASLIWSLGAIVCAICANALKH